MKVAQAKLEAPSKSKYTSVRPLQLFSDLTRIKSATDALFLLIFLWSVSWLLFVIERDMGSCISMDGMFWDVMTTVTNLGIFNSGTSWSVELGNTFFTRWIFCILSCMGLVIWIELFKWYTEHDKLNPRSAKALGELGKKRCELARHGSAAGVIQCAWKSWLVKHQMDKEFDDDEGKSQTEFAVMYYKSIAQLSKKVEMWKEVRVETDRLMAQFNREIQDSNNVGDVHWLFKSLEEVESVEKHIRRRSVNSNFLDSFGCAIPLPSKLQKRCLVEPIDDTDETRRQRKQQAKKKTSGQSKKQDLSVEQLMEKQINLNKQMEEILKELVARAK